MKTRMTVIVLTALFVGVVVAGCATTGRQAQTPEEAIQAGLEDWQTAMKNQDIEGIMALFSEQFEHFDWRDKAGARRFIQEAMDIGYLDDVVINLDSAAIKVDGGMASVYPVEISGAFGTLSMELFLTLENGNWLLTGLDAPGM